MTTPVWLGATSGQAPKAQQIDQFLGTHAITCVYTGASVSSQTTAGSGGTNTNSLWLAQSFTTGASTTATGRASLFLGYTGTPAPLTLSLYATSGSAPTGSALASTLVPLSYLTAGGATVSIPLPASALSPSTGYWLVIAAVGDVSNYYTWSKSNQVTGASTSTNGTSWTAQAYGFLYTVYDQSVVLPLTHTWEDAGARWTAWTVSSGQPTKLQEYTAAQTAADYMYSARTLTYSSSLLTSVS